MEDIVFKKDCQQGLYSYLNILQPPIISASPVGGTEAILYNYQFHNYIALAEYLTAHLEKYILIRYSPYLLTLPFLKTIETTSWKYIILSNDQYGLGIDKGFLNVKELSEEDVQLCTASKLLPLTELPEDTFGDAISWITIFGLKDNRTTALESFLQSSDTPVLSDFLQKDEVFVHVVNSKEEGYYNSLLIESNDDIEQDLYAFQTVLDPNN